MFYLEHRVGALSNIIISAHYAPVTSSGEALLSKTAVYATVRSVIDKYPELSIIGIRQELGEKGHHALNLAALHEIDLETCIEFRDDESPSATAEVVQRLHNTWNWTDKQFHPRQPWWKVVVLGRQEVVFVFHHLVCDGRFGYFFHGEFLAGINSFHKGKAASTMMHSSHVVKIDIDRVRLDKDVQDFWLSSTSVVRIIHVFLSFVILRLFLGRRLLFADVPKAKPYSESVVAEASVQHRTKTRVASLRISAPRMRRIISACRERNVTFTPLLLTMALCTLACDYYPDAKVGISNCALDMRGVYPCEEEGSGRLLQCAGGHSKFSWLDRHRRAFSRRDARKKDDDVKARVDKDAAWALVREYRASLAKSVAVKDSPALVTFKAANSMTNDLEGMLSSNFPALGLHLQNCFQVSNLGAFAAADQVQGGGPWKIDDVSFSAACINGNISYNLNLSVAGVEGGDTVILACYEDGILSEEMVSGVLEGTLERMEAVL